jgi:hypothetical protein
MDEQTSPFFSSHQKKKNYSGQKPNTHVQERGSIKLVWMNRS